MSNVLKRNWGTKTNKGKSSQTSFWWTSWHWLEHPYIFHIAHYDSPDKNMKFHCDPMYNDLIYPLGGVIGLHKTWLLPIRFIHLTESCLKLPLICPLNTSIDSRHVTPGSNDKLCILYYPSWGCRKDRNVTDNIDMCSSGSDFNIIKSNSKYNNNNCKVIF